MYLCQLVTFFIKKLCVLYCRCGITPAPVKGKNVTMCSWLKMADVPSGTMRNRYFINLCSFISLFCSFSLPSLVILFLPILVIFMVIIIIIIESKYIFIIIIMSLLL